MTYRSMLLLRVAAIGLTAVGVVAVPSAAVAQTAPLSLPPMSLAEALQKISKWSGRSFNVDPDAIKGMTSKQVVDAGDADDAVRQATRGLPISLERDGSGVVTVGSDIIVTARRNEAETNVLVRGQTTSSRLGQTLREEARNTQVISAKLLERQQARTLVEALTNSAGVVANTATVQGGVNFTVRGFDSNGSVNGLPSTSSSTFAAGASQPLANVERIEVLSGPDAILLGGGSIGGTINIVTRKPSAEPLLSVTTETGSFGEVRGTIDANTAISNDRRLSGRVIATAASADRNFGGYRGNEDYLFAPSLRYKNADTDIILSASISNQIFGTIPYTIFNPTTRRPFDVPYDRPLIGRGEDQFAQITQSQFNAEVTHDVSDWLTVVIRGQHQTSGFSQRQYSPFAVLGADGTLLVSSSGTRQDATTNVLDSYARLRFKTGPFSHRLVAGYTRFETEVEAFNANNGSFRPYNFLTQRPPLAPLATSYSLGFTSKGTQSGYYAQYLLGIWKIRLLAAVRHNRTRDLTKIPNFRNFDNRGTATTPNYGAVFEVTDNLSVFGTLAYGFQPTFNNDRQGNPLPDIETRNLEGGVKWDLFNKKMLINASYFSLRQSNLLFPDPAAPGFQIPVPGQLGKGVDVSMSGEPMKGLVLSASFTRTDYKFLTPSATLGNVVQGQSRDIYNLYSSYQHKLSEKNSAGLGFGLSGRSSSSVDRFGRFTVPASLEANLNAFVTLDKLDINVGVRNLFDRQNFFRTFFESYLPVGAPRTWRATLGYRFK